MGSDVCAFYLPLSTLDIYSKCDNFEGKSVCLTFDPILRDLVLDYYTTCG